MRFPGEICRTSKVHFENDVQLISKKAARGIAKQNGGPALCCGLDPLCLCFPSKLRIQPHLPRFPPVSLLNGVGVEKGDHLTFLKHLDHLLDVKFLQLVDVFLPFPPLLLLFSHLTGVRQLLNGLRR